MSGGPTDTPLVSVGIPVFNEAEQLPAALESILAQDYERLEVIVCDNASTDVTAATAQEFASRDPRVTVHLSTENRGAAVNFNRCFQLASGEYFTWASGHDTRAASAIRLCVEALEDDPSLVLCYPRAVWRRFDGSVEEVTDDQLETAGLPAMSRLRATIETLESCNSIHGVIRSSALARTRLLRTCFSADHVLLAELSLLGGFHQLDGALFVRAENRPPETDADWLARSVEMSGARGSMGRTRPYTSMGAEHLAGVWFVSSGVTKPVSAARAGLWYWRRWKATLLAEWRLAPAYRLLATLRRRLRPGRRAHLAEP